MLRKPIHLFFYLLVSLTLVTSLGGCASPTTESTSIKRTEILMGTPITLTLFNTSDTSILDEAFELIKNLENELSLNQSNTLLTTLNAQSGKSPVEVTKDLYTIVERGLYYSQLTSGAFDLTVGPLVKLWSIGLPEARVPSQAEIDNVLPLIDYNQVALLPETTSIYLKKPHMALDLGSIAKGYTADRLVDFLKDKGIKHALIDLGGNIYTVGTKPDGSLWRVGIQDPFNPRNTVVGAIGVANQSVVTSGIYERFIEKDGISYHHLLDPKTGYPFDNQLAGVTIISDFSIDGDALSTSVFALGLEKGLPFIESLDGIEAIFITKDREIYTTSGLKDRFSFTQTDTFTLVE